MRSLRFNNLLVMSLCAYLGGCGTEVGNGNKPDDTEVIEAKSKVGEKRADQAPSEAAGGSASTVSTSAPKTNSAGETVIASAQAGVQVEPRSFPEGLLLSACATPFRELYTATIDLREGSSDRRLVASLNDRRYSVTINGVAFATIDVPASGDPSVTASAIPTTKCGTVSSATVSDNAYAVTTFSVDVTYLGKPWTMNWRVIEDGASHRLMKIEAVDVELAKKYSFE